MCKIQLVKRLSILMREHELSVSENSHGSQKLKPSRLLPLSEGWRRWPLNMEADANIQNMQ